MGKTVGKRRLGGSGVIQCTAVRASRHELGLGGAPIALLAEAFANRKRLPRFTRMNLGCSRVLWNPRAAGALRFA